MSYYWPGSNTPKSQNNAFDWRAQRSELTDKLKGAKTGPKPQTSSRYHEDSRKAQIFDLRGIS